MNHISTMLYLKRRVIAATQIVLFLFLLSSSLLLISPAQAQQSDSISGSVFEDLNLNQVFNLHEQALDGWTVNLYKGNALLKTATTNILGEYAFNNLKLDIYEVKLEVPNTWVTVGKNSVSVDLKLNLNIQVDFANYKIVADRMNISGPFGGMSVSNQSIKMLSPTSVQIIWFTNRLSTSQVVFGQNSIQPSSVILRDNNFGYQQSSDFDFLVNTFRTVVLNNLKPNTTYYYRVASLPNPTQWRGANRIFSEEFSFTTSRIVDELESKFSNDLGIIKGVDFRRTATQTVVIGAGGEASSEPTENENEEDGKGEMVGGEATAPTEKNCTAYIWILLILNVIVIAYAASRSKESKGQNLANMWWILAILVIVPVILGYAECWLVIWLLIMLIAEVILISALNKKKEEPPV